MIRLIVGSFQIRSPNTMQAKVLHTHQISAGTTPMVFAIVVEFMRDPAPAHEAAMDMAYHRRGFVLNLWVIDNFTITPPLFSVGDSVAIGFALNLCARSDAELIASFQIIGYEQDADKTKKRLLTQTPMCGSVNHTNPR